VQEGYGRSASGAWEQDSERVERATSLAPENASVHVAAAEILAVASTWAPDESKDALVERSLQALRLALSSGFNDLSYLRSCTELSSVRALPRFEALLAARRE
jgi:hypothetical protein